MDNLNAPSERNRVFKVAIALVVGFFIAGLLLYYFSAKKPPLRKEAPASPLPQGIQLTPEEKKELIEKMTAPSGASPSLSSQEQEKLQKAMTASPDAKPSLSEEELEKLIKLMSK